MDLINIKYSVDPALKELTQKKLDEISSILLALRRIRPSWINYFEDFVAFLKKVQKQDPELFIYQSYSKCLAKELDRDLFESLYDFLDSKGYDELKLSNILSTKTYDEGAFLNRLPKNNIWFLWLCIFYLYQPRLSQKFFWDKLNYLSSEEEALLSNYRVLPFKLQNKVSEYIQQLAEQAN